MGQYPLERRLRGHHSQSGHSGKEEKSCQKSNPGHLACSLVTILTELSQAVEARLQYTVHVAEMRETRNGYKILVIEPAEKQPLESCKR
jgi:hypothetical protein